MTHPLLFLILTLLLSFVGSTESLAVGGSWHAYVKNGDSEQLQFSLHMDDNGQIGRGFDRSDFTDLTQVQVQSAERVPVRFELRREAGTVTFDGTFRDGRGGGDFTFVPSRDYAKRLEWLRVEFERKEVDEDGELFSLAINDVSTEFIRSMQMIGYKEPLERYEEFRIFRVDPAYVSAMSAVGFKKLSAEKLVETRIHNVTPEYIVEMRSKGNDLTLDQYVQSRIFQVTPEFADEMSRVGYRDLDHETLVQFKTHGVSADFVRQLRKLGYTRVPAEQLVAMRIHGVTPEFIQRVADAGYRNVPIERLVEMRIFNIDPKMVEALDEGR